MMKPKVFLRGLTGQKLVLLVFYSHPHRCLSCIEMTTKDKYTESVTKGLLSRREKVRGCDGESHTGHTISSSHLKPLIPFLFRGINAAFSSSQQENDDEKEERSVYFLVDEPTCLFFLVLTEKSCSLAVHSVHSLFTRRGFFHD